MKKIAVNFTSLVMGSALLLSACGPLIEFGDDAPPPRLYSIQPLVGSEFSIDGPVLYISEPLMPAEANSTRIAVRTEEFELSHLEGGRWSENFSVMLHRYIVSDLLASDITAQIVGAGALDIRADCRLALNFQRFEYNVQDGSINVSAIARLSSLSKGSLLSSKNIQVSQDVSNDSSDAIVAGYNEATGGITDALNLWLRSALVSCKSAKQDAASS